MGLFGSLLARVTGRGGTPAGPGPLMSAAGQPRPLSTDERKAILDGLSPGGEESKYMDWQHGSSSWITALRFNPLIPRAQMQTKSGKVYSFGGMTFTVFKAWLASSSWGEYFNRHLKGKYTQWEEFVSVGKGIKAEQSRSFGTTVLKELGIK